MKCEGKVEGNTSDPHKLVKPHLRIMHCSGVRNLQTTFAQTHICGETVYIIKLNCPVVMLKHELQ